MNINKKIATKVFSRLKYFKKYKVYKGSFSNNGKFDKDGYPLIIFYRTNCGLTFEAYKVYRDNLYEVFPKIGSVTCSDFYVDI